MHVARCMSKTPRCTTCHTFPRRRLDSTHVRPPAVQACMARLGNRRPTEPAPTLTIQRTARTALLQRRSMPAFPMDEPAASERLPPSEDRSRRHCDPLLVRARQTRDLLRAHAGSRTAHLQQRPPPVHTVRVVPADRLQMASFTSGGAGPCADMGRGEPQSRRCRCGRGEPSLGADVGALQSRCCRCGRGGPSPGAEMAGMSPVSPVPVQMWAGGAHSRWCRCGRGGPTCSSACASRSRRLLGSSSATTGRGAVLALLCSCLQQGHRRCACGRQQAAWLPYDTTYAIRLPAPTDSADAARARRRIDPSIDRPIGRAERGRATPCRMRQRPARARPERRSTAWSVGVGER